MYINCLFAVGLRIQSYSSKVAKLSDASANNETSESNSIPPSTTIPSNSRFIYPEFLPDPDPKYRNPIKEKLERMDMISRR